MFTSTIKKWMLLIRYIYIKLIDFLTENLSTNWGYHVQTPKQLMVVLNLLLMHKHEDSNFSN